MSLNFHILEVLDVEFLYYTVGKISRIWELRGANIRYLDPNPKLSPKTWEKTLKKQECKNE